MYLLNARTFIAATHEPAGIFSLHECLPVKCNETTASPSTKINDAHEMHLSLGGKLTVDIQFTGHDDE